MIRIFNSGAGTVTTSVGRLDSGKYLDIPDMEAKKLLGMYEHLKDAKVMIGMSADPKEEPKEEPKLKEEFIPPLEDVKKPKRLAKRKKR
jgi:hypothetical protein